MLGSKLVVFLEEFYLKSFRRSSKIEALKSILRHLQTTTIMIWFGTSFKLPQKWKRTLQLSNNMTDWPPPRTFPRNGSFTCKWCRSCILFMFLGHPDFFCAFAVNIRTVSSETRESMSSLLLLLSAWFLCAINKLYVVFIDLQDGDFSCIWAHSLFL